MNESAIAVALIPITVSVLLLALIVRTAAGHDLSLIFKGFGISLKIEKTAPKASSDSTEVGSATSEQ